MTKKKEPHLLVKVGRPTDYEPVYCDLFKEELKKGKTMAQVSMALNVPWSTITNWRNAHPEFMTAIEDGLVWSESAFTEQTKNLWVGEHVNTRLIELHARNCYKWSTKDKDNVLVVGSGVTDDAIAKVSQILANNNPQASK